METNYEIKNNSLFIRLTGELDHHYATRLRDEIDKLIREGNVNQIVFDFSKVGFMDSSGIGVIIGRYKLMQAVGGNVAAFGIRPALDKLMTMSGIKKIINVYETEKEVK